MQIERHEIRVLSAVIEEGGFSRAAERLNVSQSAVSQAIANLEHKLNTALLVRGRIGEGWYDLDRSVRLAPGTTLG